MPDLTYRDALKSTLVEEMDRDPRVLLMGEDIGVYGGTFLVTEGLLARYGPKRVIDTPISEAGFIGCGIGMAMLGLRPVIEVMTWNFSLIAADQIIQNAAKIRYFSGGQAGVPMVIRGPNGAGVQLSAQHSQALEALYGYFPGLYVAAPATPADARGLLRTAIRASDPVIFLENASLYGLRGEVPDGDYVVPFGRAAVARHGRDVTLVTHGRTLHMTLRAVVIEDQGGLYGVAGEVMAGIYERAFDDLDAPVVRVSGEDVPMPYARTLELLAQPNEAKIVEAVRRTVA